MKGLWQLTWLEIKIFVREPLGLIGSVGVPVAIFLLFGRLLGGPGRPVPRDVPRAITADLPILTSILIIASTVLSLVAIIAIYREGGILRRLRATPLRSHTILTAHVLVKLLLTVVTLAAMLLAGRRYDLATANTDASTISVLLGDGRGGFGAAIEIGRAHV